MMAHSTHHRPWYALTLDGRDITPRISPILESLTLIDKRGFEADELDITLDDSAGTLDIPPRGARLHVALGWYGQPLIDKGSYVVDELEHSGAPDRLTLRARSADLRTGLSTQREQSWHQASVSHIVQSIAERSGLVPVVADALAGHVFEHIDQTDESDAHLLSRLARDLDAMATVKAGRLLFMPLGQGNTASGHALAPVILTRASGDQHRFHVADRSAYTGVRAHWHDATTGRKREEIAGDEAAPQNARTTQPSAGNIKTLRHSYPSQRDAQTAAQAEWQRLQRGIGQFSLTLAHGRPELHAELPVYVSGFKPQIDETAWIIATATHRLSTSGMHSILEFETLQN